MTDKIGVILLNFGEPESASLEEVVPFLERIFASNASLEPGMSREGMLNRAHELAIRRAPGLVEDYRAIGGSPLAAQCRAEARSLAEAGFVFEIEGIEAVEEEIEIRTWKVMTRAGRRSFQTKRDEWPRDVPGGGLLIRDVTGDLFLVPDPSELDKGSQRRLWAFTD